MSLAQTLMAWWRHSVDWLVTVRSDDPQERRRGQSLILLVSMLVGLSLISMPPMILTAQVEARWLVFSSLTVCQLIYLSGLWLARRGAVTAAGFLVSLTISAIVILSSYGPGFGSGAWFVASAMLVAGYALRPALLWVVLLAAMLMLSIAWWGLIGTPHATPLAHLFHVFLLLLLFTISMFLHGLWSARVFGMQLQSEQEARASRADAEQAREEAEQARTEAELARARAERASRSKSTFLANMSHELRTPLNAIIGYSEMLQEEYGGEDELMGQDLSRIQTAGKHLLGLINDILDLSKIEAGRMSLYAEDFSVASLMSEVWDTVAPAARRQDITLDVSLSEHIGTMRADRTKLRQVLINIVANAVKFTERGQVSIHARSELREGGEMLVFEVQDTGVGMSPEVLARVFGEFEQADNSTTRKVGGTGLGLAVCKRLCELMGGHVSATSQEGQGSLFVVVVPRVQLSHTTDAHPELQGGLGTAGHALSVDADPSWPHVLVIDDDVATRDYLTRQLMREGFYPVLAASGEEGLARLEQGDIALVILDLLLPGIDGWEVLRQLKATRPELPVVLASVMDDREQAFTLGASAYLVKPLARQDLLSVLERLLGGLLPDAASAVDVLVVEDDEASRSLLRRYLNDERWVIREAHDGLQALERLEEQLPQVVLLDLMMPQMDGFDVLERLRANPAWRHIPVIIVTAKSLTPQEQAYLRQGAAHIFHKGALSRRALLGEVRAALQP